MKRKYFRIKNEMYFSILIAIYTMNKTGQFYKNAYLASETHCLQHKYVLKPTVFSAELLQKMIKCCGHSFFEKGEPYYFVKCEDFINVFLIFKHYIISSENKDKILLKIQKNIKKHLAEHLHQDFEKKITLLKENPDNPLYAVNEFTKEYNIIDKGFTHFLCYYYSKPKESLPAKKKILVVRKIHK